MQTLTNQNMNKSVQATVIVHNVQMDRTNNFSFFIENQRGRGDPWQNYMGKGKLEIGRMVIRISVQYRGAVN